MQDSSLYPHFIPDTPIGEDCFEGHSHKNLAYSICDYIRTVDSYSCDKSNGNMPRIIGLEGNWGAGKSNIIRMLDSSLEKEGYYTFIYDAWGHQEDLQRRSILESLTVQLVNDGVLRDDVELQLRNGKTIKKKWSEHLSYLLSNKTTTIRKSTPKLTSSAIWGIGIFFMYVFCSLIAEQLISIGVESYNYWKILLLDLFPIFFSLVAVCFLIKRDGGIENVFRMIDYTKNDTIDEEYISSEEPSTSEFKNWLRAISGYLKKTEFEKNRLIIVFDNMDRLSSEKVLQLWSSIYAFFSGGEFERIWTVVPYDYKQLFETIYGHEQKLNSDDNRIKEFISKIFPITYHVPHPVTTDFRKLFFTYFDRAFGTTVQDREHICQVFMLLQDNPNPRTVIRFVNELVSIRKHWNDDRFSLMTQALYVLKRHWILYDDAGSDANLLSDHLFDKISSFYPDRERVRTELCQYTYGLEDEHLASELPLLRELSSRVVKGDSIESYAGLPNFIPLLEKVLNHINGDSVNLAVNSMISIDQVDFSKEDAVRVQSKWEQLAIKKLECKYDNHEYDNTITILINHSSPELAVRLARNFVNKMQNIEVTNGKSYFITLNMLSDSLRDANVQYDDSNWYSTLEVSPKYFVQYVAEAGDRYQKYRLITNSDKLNEYMLNLIKDGNEEIASIVDYIKDDKNYNLQILHQDLSKLIIGDVIKTNIHTVAYINRILTPVNEFLQVRFNKATLEAYLNEHIISWKDYNPKGFEDVLVLSLAEGIAFALPDDRLIPSICSCLERYIKYTDLLKSFGKNLTFRKLNVYFIQNRMGSTFDPFFASSNLLAIQQSLGLDISSILKQFNRWTVDWGEITADNNYIKNVKRYVLQSLFRAYLDNPGSFSKDIISLGVHALSFQPSGFLVKKSYRQPSYTYRREPCLVIDSYWKDFVNTYLGTEYMEKAGVPLTGEAITLISWLLEHNENKDPVFLDKILTYADESVLKNYLHKIMNDSLTNKAITKSQFLVLGNLLPKLGSNMDTNKARHLINNFISPIYRDSECAKIILANKDFYLEIINYDKTISAPITNEMIKLDFYKPIENKLEQLIKNE